jgi:hypothetical protein
MEPEQLFTELRDDKKPWHRQSRMVAGKPVWESGKAFAAFKQFCVMGDDRGIRKVAAVLSKSPALISRWCQVWKWRERAKVFDDVLQDATTQAFLKERIRMGQRQANLGVLGQNIAAQALADINRRIQEAGGMARMKLTDVIRLLDVSTKLEQSVRGKVDDDAVAKIEVHVHTREGPRYEDEAELEKERDKKPN